MDIIADILSEFFEITVYNILYIRRLYPDGVFVKRKKYGIPVQICVHPALSEYVVRCLKSIKNKLLFNEIQAIIVAFLDETGVILERFVIEIGDIKMAVSHCEHNMAVIEEVLRAFCLKIATCSADLEPLPEGCRFKLFLQTRGLTPMETQPIVDPTKDIVWIEAECGQSRIDNPSVIPVRSADNSVFQMQLFVETKNQIKLD